MSLQKLTVSQEGTGKNPAVNFMVHTHKYEVYMDILRIHPSMEILMTCAFWFYKHRRGDIRPSFISTKGAVGSDFVSVPQSFMMSAVHIVINN